MVIPRGSGIPTISVGIPWKKVGISMELESKMAEAPANCFPLKFHGILQNSNFPLGIQWNPQELMEEGKDLSQCSMLTCTALKNGINIFIGVKGHHMMVGKVDLEVDDIGNFFMKRKVEYSPYSIWS